MRARQGSDRAGRVRRPARCSSRARPAPARSWWRARFTPAAAARREAVRRAQLRGADRIAARERAVRPRARRVHRRGRGAAGPDRARAAAARSSSTRSARCRRRCRPSCCARSKPARCAASARTRRGAWTSGSSRPPISTSRRAIDSGDFRSDLFYRLNVHRIHLPPLRERGDDVRLLIEHFIARFGGGDGDRLHPGRASALLAYDYPGNMRQLQHIVQRAVAVARGELIDVDDLPEEVVATRGRVTAAAGGQRRRGPRARRAGDDRRRRSQEQRRGLRRRARNAGQPDDDVAADEEARHLRLTGPPGPDPLCFTAGTSPVPRPQPAPAGVSASPRAFPAIPRLIALKPRERIRPASCH